MSTREFHIAVMIPTRSRTTPLGRSLFSMIDLAADLSKIEFLMAIDDDDEIALDYFFTHIQPRFDQQNINYTVLSTPRLGYEGLAKYFNILADKAKADWLMVWTDDAIMETQDWDLRITECTGEFKLLKVHTHNEHPYSIFPILPVEWYDVIGYFAKHQMIDAEVSQIAYMLDIMKIIEVNVTHDRVDLTGNNNDATQQNKTIFEGNPSDPRDFHYPTFTQGRQKDLNKLVNYMKSMDLDLTYYNNIVAGTQNPWQRMRENDPNGQTGQFEIVQDTSGKTRMVKR